MRRPRMMLPVLVGLLSAAVRLQQQSVEAACDLQLSQSFDQYSGSQSYTQSMMQQDFPDTLGPFKRLGGETKMVDGQIYGFFPKGTPQDLVCTPISWARNQQFTEDITLTQGADRKAATEIVSMQLRRALLEGKILAYDSGFSWYSILPKPLSEAMMEYDIQFDAGFDWTLGGKLPGLCGHDCPVGCSVVSRDRGWSTRLMWRKHGTMVTYAYYPDKPPALRCGEDWDWSGSLNSGQWYKFRIYVKINTPGQNDGIARAWVDNQMVMEKRDIPYRYKDSSAYTITRAYLTTYVGGSSVDMFAPDHDQFIKFDNFKVWEGDCDAPGGAPASTPNPAPEPAPAPAPEPAPAPAPEPVPSNPGPEPTPAPTPTSTPTPSSGSPSGYTDQGAPKSLNGYLLYKGEPDWDLLQRQTIGDAKAPDGSGVADVVAFCIDKCNGIQDCAVFTIYKTGCYFRRLTDEEPVKVGPNSPDKMIYLYVKDVTGVGASAPQPAPQPDPVPAPVPVPEVSPPTPVAVEPTPIPSPVAAPIPDAPAPSTGSSGLAVSFAPDGTFYGGFCASLLLSNLSPSQCTTWTLTLAADESAFDMSKFTFWGMTDLGGLKTFGQHDPGQSIGPNASLDTFKPGMCAFYADKSRGTNFDLTMALAGLAFSGTCV